MLNPRVASRYAKSLLDLAVERDELEIVYKDMLYLQDVMKGSREFMNLLRSPVVKADVKIRAVNSVTAGNISAMTTKFTELLINKTREVVLPEVITSFIKQYKEHRNIHDVKLTTAQPIGEELKNAIMEQVRKTGDMQNIQLETVVDPKIIGGFVLQAGDKLVDASISYDLKEIAKQFENNDFIYKVR